MDFADVLSKKRRRTRTVYVLLDEGLAVERDRLLVEAAVAEKQDEWINRKPLAPAMKERIRELDAEIAANQVPFVFQAMPRSRWVELVAEFTDDDDELDPEGFGPWLLAESSLDPVMTVEQVREMWQEWSAAETEQLYIAAYRVNREVRDIPFISPGIEPMSSSGENSTTALPGD